MDNNIIIKLKKNKNEIQIYYILAGYLVWGIFWGSWGVILPGVKYNIGLNETQLGNSLIMISIGAVFAMLITGVLIKSFRKELYIASLVSFGLSVILISFANNITTLRIILFFVGATSGFLDVIMNTGVSLLESTTGKKYFSKAHAAFPIAVIVTGPLVGIARNIGVPIGIIALIIGFIIILLGLLSYKADLDFLNSNSTKVNKKEKQQFSLSGSIVFLGIMGLLVHIMENGIEQWSAIYLEVNLHANPIVSSLGLTIYMLMLFLIRLQDKRIAKYLSEKKLLMISCLISFLGLLVVSSSKSSFIAIIGFCLIGLALAPIIPMIYSLASVTIDSEHRVSAISSITVIAYLGYLLSPSLMGAISSINGLNFAWLFLSLMSVLCFINIISFFDKVIKNR